jgi:hypothetical protein
MEKRNRIQKKIREGKKKETKKIKSSAKAGTDAQARLYRATMVETEW